MKVSIPTSSVLLKSLFSQEELLNIKKRRNDLHSPTLKVQVLSGTLHWTMFDEDAVIGEVTTVETGHIEYISVENGFADFNIMKVLGAAGTEILIEIVTNSTYTGGVGNGATEAKQDDILTETKAFGTLRTTAVTLAEADTAELLPDIEQANRRGIILYNVSDTDMYYGDSSVTTTNGILLASGAEVSLDISTGLYVVCGVDNKTINILELK